MHDIILLTGRLTARVAGGLTGWGTHKMFSFLRYITNNEAQSRHEVQFDVFFWLVETLALVLGTWILAVKHDGEWIPFLVIEYCWAMDNLRHNRP